MENQRNSADSSATGNTNSVASKQISPAKQWCFTLNNYNEEDLEFLSSTVPHFEKCIIGKEVSSTGTPHLQGYVKFKDKKRPLSLFPNLGAHWEKKSKFSTEMDNYNYCTKEGNIFLNIGFPKPPRTISVTQFYPWQKRLADIFAEPCDWDSRDIHWVYGDYGIGKTQFAKWLCVHRGGVVIGGTHKHMLAQVQKAQAGLYIILLSKGDNKVSYRAIEQIKDGLFTSAFGTDNNHMTIMDSPHILIIGNEPPDTCNRHYHPDKYLVQKVSAEGTGLS